MRLDELIVSGDAPYDWSAVNEDSEGDTVLGHGRFPDLAVQRSSHADVKSLRWHVVECNVLDDPNRAYIVGRLVAELHDGREIEVGDRICIPRNVIEHQADTTKCAACGRSIVSCSSFAIREGVAYCQICSGGEDGSLNR